MQNWLILWQFLFGEHCSTLNLFFVLFSLITRLINTTYTIRMYQNQMVHLSSILPALVGPFLHPQRSTLICPNCQKLPQKVTILAPPRPTMSEFDVQQINKHSHIIIIAHIYHLLTFAIFMFSKATGANHVFIHCVHSLLVVLMQGCSCGGSTYHSFYRMF